MRFTDMPNIHWAYSYVALLYCNGVISGYDDGTFRPGNTTSRAQLAKMLALAFGWTLYNPIMPDFSDVPFGSTYYQFIETAYTRGIISGYSDGTFRPGNPVTRAQVTKMLVLAKGWEQVFPSVPDFTDVPADFWAYGFVEAAFTRGVISGYNDGTFLPGNPVNRAQFCKMLTFAIQQPQRRR